MPGYRRVRNEDFSASSFSSRPFFVSSILFVCRPQKTRNDGKIWVSHLREFVRLVTSNTTLPIHQARQTSCDTLSKQELIGDVRFFSAAALTVAKKRS